MGKVAPSGRPKLIDYIRAFEKSLKKIYDGSNMYHTDNVSEEAFDEITQILERDCQKFIKELRSTSNDHLIFRGIKYAGKRYNNIDGIWMKKSRKDRFPADTNYDISMEFDDHFRKSIGIPLRKHGIFTTKNPRTSQEEETGIDPLRDIKYIVDGYKSGNIEDVDRQEITFIADKYYLIDEKYYFKIKDWLFKNTK